MTVSGNSFQRASFRCSGSYYFSKYAHLWGWATWRRAWRHYDFRMQSWPAFRDQGFMRQVCEDEWEARYWTSIFDRAHADPLAFNDYGTQWLYCCWTHSGLTALPSRNLVSNIGFGADATHTAFASEWASLPAEELGEIEHPNFVVKHPDADRWTFDHVFLGRFTRRPALINWLFRATWPIRKTFRRATARWS